MASRTIPILSAIIDFFSTANRKNTKQKPKKVKIFEIIVVASLFCRCNDNMIAYMVPLQPANLILTNLLKLHHKNWIVQNMYIAEYMRTHTCMHRTVWQNDHHLTVTPSRLHFIIYDKQLWCYVIFMLVSMFFIFFFIFLTNWSETPWTGICGLFACTMDVSGRPKVKTNGKPLHTFVRCNVDKNYRSLFIVV